MPAKADRPEETQSRECVLAEIKQLVAHHDGRPLASLQDDADLMVDLGYDSLDVVELIMNLEERFNIVVPDDRVDKAPTIRRITDTVMELLRSA